MRPESGAGVLHEIFERQANARPESAAVIFGAEQASYAQLELRANRLARHLRKRGVRRGSTVAMLLPRSIDAYAALLGILKAGAAYVPIDPEYPADRVAYILQDCGANALVTTGELAARHAGAQRLQMVRMDADCEALEAESGARLPRGEVGVGARDLAYIIYTSGSTGRPKGVMVEHRSASHLVRAEGQVYGVLQEDRIYQGASLSFDLSVEEIWLAFQAGATLVAASPEMCRAGPDLSRLLAASGVTVLSSVPTLVSMLAEDVPSVRLLIFGGEVCPEQLVARWARPGRRIMNTYGPTETTVIATCAELRPGQPVTIGRAIPGYRVYLLDDALRPVPAGAVGEICIAGAGVARGYVGLEAQTSTRFLADPCAPADEPGALMYRTGDRGRFDAEGNIEFAGRADSQVKIRGFRVELAEIEAVLAQADGVRAAACALREDTPGIAQLVGYVVAGENARVNTERLRNHLRDRLPSYMVPALLEPVDALPRLPSGKLDRASLPAPRARPAATAAPGRKPRTDTERRIAAVWEQLFHPQPVSVEQNFFLDLGGHSLLAARMVSELRKHPRFVGVSVSEVYEHPTIESLAGALDAAASQPRAARVAPRAPRPGERARHFRAGVLQAGALYFGFGFRALLWVTPFLLFSLLLSYEWDLPEAAAWAAAAAVTTFPALAVVAILAKWLLLGRIRAGRYPLWGAYYLRFWFVRSLVAALPLVYLQGTPLLNFVYRLLGARIGKDVHLETHGLAAFDLISIGDGTSVAETAALLGTTVEDGELVIGPVRIGRDCFVGTRAVLREHTRLEDGARLDDLSLLPYGGHIPRGQTWAGSPARPAAAPVAAMPPRPARTALQRAATAVLYAAVVLLMPLLPLAAFVPGVAVLMQIDPLEETLLYLGAVPLVGASFVLMLATSVTAAKWLLVGRVRPGTYPVHGGFFIRKWIVDQLLALSLRILGSLHATVHLAPYYRALGARLGKFVEFSTAGSVTPDLLEVADGGTIADEVSLGAPRVEGGWLTLARTGLGRRAFAGNGSIVRQGVSLGDASLLGVVSISPADPESAARPGATWLGSPPMPLPRRQPSTAFPEARTYWPTPRLRLARGSFELLRVTLPPAGYILVTSALLLSTLELVERIGLGGALLALPVVYAACCAALALTVALVKWAVMGRFRPFEQPQWSLFVWKLEFVNALYEFMLAPLALEPLHGTPFLPWYFRLLGARIGRRTYFHSTGLIEFDLAEVGDDAVVNEEAVLQTHLFEDRILKADRLRIGQGCELGEGSVVLYGSQMEDGAQLGSLSLLMKGEILPAGTRWEGNPAAASERRAPPQRAGLPGKRRSAQDGRSAWIPA